MMAGSLMAVFSEDMSPANLTAASPGLNLPNILSHLSMASSRARALHLQLRPSALSLLTLSRLHVHT